MFKDKDGKLWIVPEEDNLTVDKDKLLQIIEDFSVWPEIPKYNKRRWAMDIEVNTGDLFDEMYMNTRKKYGMRNLAISDARYPKNNPQSIYWEVFDLLDSAYMNNVEIKDIPMLKEFLNTPPGKELEAWKKWDAYWAKRQEESKKDTPVPPKEE
jgi:hypothetical protein